MLLPFRIALPQFVDFRTDSSRNETGCEPWRAAGQVILAARRRLQTLSTGNVRLRTRLFESIQPVLKSDGIITDRFFALSTHVPHVCSASCADQEKQ
jgi:hypothetical protein